MDLIKSHRLNKFKVEKKCFYYIYSLYISSISDEYFSKLEKNGWKLTENAFKHDNNLFI